MVTFLLVIGEDLSFSVVDNLSRNHLRYVHERGSLSFIARMLVNPFYLTFINVTVINAIHFFSDFMDSNMDKTKHMLNFLYPLIGRASPELKDFLDK